MHAVHLYATGGDQSLLDRSQTDVSEEGEKNKTVTHVVITAC